MTDRSSWWDGVSWEQSNGQWRVWDGAEWKLVDRAYTWDGTEWVLIYPHFGRVHEASEATLLLDRASVLKIDFFQQYTADEAALLLDRADIRITSRNINKSGRELIAISEDPLIKRKISIAEATLLLDRASIRITDRNVNKPGRELMSIAEAASLKRSISIAEATLLLDRANVDIIDRNVNKSGRELLVIAEDVPLLARRVTVSEATLLLDRAAVTTTSRNIVYSGRDLIALTEAASVSITELVPIASNAQANWASCAGNATIQCNADAYCESIKIRYRIDGGSWATMGTYNTTPSTTFGPETLNPTPSGSDVQFEIEPWTGDGATGNSGTKITSNIAECGGPE